MCINGQAGRIERKVVMPDLSDSAQDGIEITRDIGLSRIRQRASEMPVGKAGECGTCGEYKARLVTGICAPCRDFLARQYVMKI
jgi:hypothetical protein